MSYNNNDWGPALDKDGNPEEETETYKQILDNIHSRRVKVLRQDDDNSKIIHQNT